MLEMMSEEILAWGGSNSRLDGFRLYLRQVSSSPTRPAQCFSMVQVFLMHDVTRLMQISITDWSLLFCR